MKITIDAKSDKQVSNIEQIISYIIRTKTGQDPYINTNYNESNQYIYSPELNNRLNKKQIYGTDIV